MMNDEDYKVRREKAMQMMRDQLAADNTEWRRLHSEAMEIFFTLLESDHTGDEIHFIAYMLQQMSTGIQVGGMITQLNNMFKEKQKKVKEEDLSYR